MSFTSMHNDYLDPDHHLGDENWGLDYEALLTELRKLDTGRWHWDRIHCCLTGKDADLEPWGQQGLELITVDEDGATLIAHAGMTIPGLDVCLNVDEDIAGNPERYDAARDEYLEIAYGLVCDFGREGYWSGDDWYLSQEERFRVPWRFSEDGVTPDYAATARDCVAVLEATLAGWEDDARLLHLNLDRAAGWTPKDLYNIDQEKPST